MGRLPGELANGARIGKRSLALLERLDSRRTNLLRALAYGRVRSAEAFERQVEHLAARHPLVSAARVLDTFEGGRALPPRAVMLLFHDERSFAAVVWPILRKRRIAAAVFLGADRAAAGALSAGEVEALLHQGAALGVSGLARDPAESAPRGSLAGDILRARLGVEHGPPGPPRLLAYSDARPGEVEVEAARSAGVELAFMALAGANDLRTSDPLRLRSIPVDGDGSLDDLRARLVRRSRPWSGRDGLAPPATPEERRSLRAFRALRFRLRYVYRPLDAILTAGIRPRPPVLAALRALVGRSSNYERLRNAMRLSVPPVPGLERRLQGALLDTSRLSLAATGIELAGHGSAATVFRLLGERGSVPHVLKVYRWTLGQPVALLLQMARRHRARYEELRRRFQECVLPAHFLVLHGPLRGLPVAACLQERIERSTDLFALPDGELVRLLRSRPELAAEFTAFARRAVAAREQGFVPDLLGARNLLLVEQPGRARIRLIDYGLFDLRFGASGLPSEAHGACVRRLESLLGELRSNER